MRPPRGPDAYPVRSTEASVSIGIDAQNGVRDIVTGDQYLDVDLHKKRIVALLVEAQAGGGASSQIMTEEIELVLGDGTTLSPASAEEAAQRGKRSATLIVFPWVVPLISPLGIVLSAVFRSKANRDMRADFTQKALPHPCRLTADEPARGYVYFILPSKESTLSGATVRVPVTDTSAGSRVVIEQTI